MLLLLVIFNFTRIGAFGRLSGFGFFSQFCCFIFLLKLFSLLFSYPNSGRRWLTAVSARGDVLHIGQYCGSSPTAAAAAAADSRLIGQSDIHARHAALCLGVVIEVLISLSTEYRRDTEAAYNAKSYFRLRLTVWCCSRSLLVRSLISSVELS